MERLAVVGARRWVAKAKVVLFSVILGGMPAMSPAIAGGPVTSNALVRLTGSIQLPGSADAAPQFVELSGYVHVVTRVIFSAGDSLPVVAVYANLPADVSAESAVGHFIAHGASRHSAPHDLGDGDIIPCVMPAFTLLYADTRPEGAGMAPITFDIKLELGFDPNGELVVGEAVAQPPLPS